MTGPRDTQREQQAGQAATDPGPEVRPEVIQDLDVTGDDDVLIVGGCEPTKAVGEVR